MKKVIAVALFAIFSVGSVFAQLEGAPQTQTHKHRLYIQNNSGIDIYNVYISTPSDNNWGVDMLGRSVMANGTTQWATLLGHRWYDIKVVQGDDTTCTQRIDLNANKTLIIQPYTCQVSGTTTNTQY